MAAARTRGLVSDPHSARWVKSQHHRFFCPEDRFYGTPHRASLGSTMPPLSRAPHSLMLQITCDQGWRPRAMTENSTLVTSNRLHTPGIHIAL